MFEWFDTYVDYPLIDLINSLSRESLLLDAAIVDFMMLDTVRILPIVTAVVMVAFMQRSSSDINRTFVTALGGAFFAIFLARIAQNISERPRPVFANIPDFQIPFGTELDIPADWSSFPSDTAALAFALATAVFLRSRALGLVCLFWALVVTSLPRVYAGYHYPSDIFAGGLIGVISALAVARFLPQSVLTLSFNVMNRHQPIYYGIVFAILYMTSTMFFDIRQTLSAIAEIALG